MLLTLWRILAKAVLTLPLRSVISNDLGEGYAEGLGDAFWGEKVEKKNVEMDNKCRKGRE